MTNEELLALIDKAAEEQWETLDLSGLGLTELPSAISKLSKLKTLILGKYDREQKKWLGNYLTSLPSEITQLTSLQTLDFSSNQLRSFPSEIGQLSFLKSLYLGKNQLITSSPKIGQLSSLEHLDFRYNQLSSLPSEIGQLSSLHYLYLGNNQLISLPPEIGQLSSLKRLNLRGNQLSSLPPEISQLSSFLYLDFSNNPLETPPLIIAQQGIKAIHDYFRQIEFEGLDTIYEAKLIIVGEGGAGKTTFAKKILDPNYKVPTPEDSTQGIDVLRWNFAQDNGANFRVNIWDFGGQEIYHATHQFFLTQRSLYVLVADSRKEHPHLDYWFHIVELLSEKSPLILIKNEVDNRPVAMDEPQFRGRFNNFKDSVTTDFAEAKDIDNIYKILKHYITSLPHVGSSWPKTWARVRERLENDERNYVSKEEYLTICEENGFKQDKDSLQLSQFLHDLGVILHFQDNLILSETIILKPEWGTDAVYKVLDNTTVKQNFGKFTNEDLSNIWSDQQYSRMLLQLLELMMKFKLCYKLPGTEDTYIAPQLLDYNQPNYNWDENNNLLLRYKYEFMPKGIITRFIVEMNRYIVDPNVWRNGVLLLREKTYAEVIESSNEKEIQVRLSGSNKRGFLEVITDKLDEINSNYHRLKVDKLIPCNCNTCKDSKDPYFHRLENLRNLLSKNRQESQCQISGEMVNIYSLIDDSIGRKELTKSNGDNNINININQGHNMNNPINQTHSSNGDNVAGNVEHNTFNAPVGVGVNKGHISDNAIVAGVDNEAPSQDITEAAAQIQALLDQLSQTYPTKTSKQKMAIAVEAMDVIEQDSSLTQRLLSAVKAGSLAAIESMLNHPAASFVIAAIEDLNKD